MCNLISPRVELSYYSAYLDIENTIANVSSALDSNTPSAHKVWGTLVAKSEDQMHLAQASHDQTKGVGRQTSTPSFCLIDACLLGSKGSEEEFPKPNQTNRMSRKACQ